MNEATVKSKKNTYSPDKNIAKDLLKINAIQLNVESPFTWVSGIQSPIYCDNRLVNSYVGLRSRIVKKFVKLIRKKFPDAQVIAGVVTGGLPFGALIADKMKLPFIYVRQEKKEHGLMKQVEGVFREGDKVVVIEDHISTGKSSLKAIQGLLNEKLHVLGLVSIMTYGFKKAENAFKEANITNYSLSNLDIVLKVALKENRITKEERKQILQFRNAQGA